MSKCTFDDIEWNPNNIDTTCTGTKYLIHGPLLQIETTTLEERKIVHEVCDIMGERGGRLAAAGLYGILKKIGRTGKSRNGSKKKTVIAMDGGLFEHHVRYRSYMEEALQELMGSDAAYEVALRLQNDGSGIGAALLAASHSHFK